MKPHILVVDDELGPRESLRAIFKSRYTVSVADSAEAAMRVMTTEKVDLMILDVIMPKPDGISFLKDIHELYPNLPVVMISASSSVRPVVEAMRVGAYDYVSKPFDVEEITHIAGRALESTALHRRVATLEREVNREFPVEGIVGHSSSFAKALEDVRKAAGTDATVLICGESGTGKELAARLLHKSSNRESEPFVAVHCGALPESLMESELFGHEKGAFTGADRLKPGRFDLAGSGTLFFDEVSEMSLTTQVKLLRVLQEREFMRVGGTRIIKTDARIVAASAKDLLKEVRNGKFRSDLYYRLSVVPVVLPPLRERPGDVVLLSQHFLRFFREVIDATTDDFAPPTMELLCAYSWPGNVRELRNVIERMLVLHKDSPLILPEFLPQEFHALPSAQPASPADGTLEERVNTYERQLIEKALRETSGVQTHAAAKLGTTRRILKYRMEKLRIDPVQRMTDATEPDDTRSSPATQEPSI
jgi:DNA-binding NtrC family response regulator